MSIPSPDADLFRVQKGQYADRWYVDPLPSCEVAEADPAFCVPSVSTIKRASGKDWTQVSLGRVAGWIHEAKPSFDGLDRATIKDHLQRASGEGLDLAMERGTQIHSMFEAVANGQDPAGVELGVEARLFRRTVLDCIEEQQPNMALCEFICLSRSVGYGGTADSIWCIDGEYWVVDYKSRNGKHDLYIEEAWQVAGYGKADYWVAASLSPEGELQHHRMAPLDLAGGLVISLTRQSYRIYEIDLEAAWGGFCTLRQHWQDRSDGKRPLVRAKWDNPTPTRDQWIRRRIELIRDYGGLPSMSVLIGVWPDGVQKPKHQTEPYSDGDIDRLLPAVEHAEAAAGAPWPPEDPGPRAGPEMPEQSSEVQEEPRRGPLEGEDWPEGAAVVARRLAALPSAAVDWISSVVVDARLAGTPIRLEETPTRRRVYIARALILACEKHLTREAFWAMVTSVIGPDRMGGSTGEILGGLDVDEAAKLAGIVSLAHSRQPDLDGVYEPPPPKITDLADLTKPELKDRCRQRGLPVGGTKQDLIERLLDQDTTGQGPDEERTQT